MVKKYKVNVKKLIGGVVSNVYGDSADKKGTQVNLTDRPTQNDRLDPSFYKLITNPDDPTGNSDKIEFTGVRRNNMSSSAYNRIREILLSQSSNKQKRAFKKQEEDNFNYMNIHNAELNQAEKKRQKQMQDDRNNPLKNEGFWDDFGQGFKEGLGNTLNYGGQAVSFIPGLEKVGEGISNAGEFIQNYGEPQDDEITENMEGGKLKCKVCNKVINKAQWKKHKNTKIHGAGLFSWLKDKYHQVKNTIVDKFKKKLDGFNNTSTRTLQKYGDFPIVALRIFKKPIHKVLNLFINALTFGKFEELKKKYSFDDMYHLGCIASVKLANGQLKEIQFEKVEAVKFFENVNVSGDDVEYLIVPLLNQTTTLNQMTEKARMAVGDKTYFDYNAFSNNCQYFIKYNILNGLNVWNDKINDFVMQDVSKLAKEIPDYAKNVMNTITDLGQIGDNLIGGNLTIHSVKVNKNLPFEQALKHAQNIIKTRRKFKNKVIGENYHFRSIPKTKFKPRSFRSKKVNDNITIVFGELK